MASADAVLTDDEKEMGVALVDIGGGTTDVAVFYDNIIRHTAVIPFGGNIVTQDIKQGCNILERYAESLKVQFGSSLADKALENKVVSIPGINGRPPKEISFKNLAHIIQSRMEEIIAQVYFQIEASGMLPHLGAGIVITGGGALLKNLSQLVAFKTGMDVRLGLPNQTLHSKVIDEVNQPIFSTGVGLMLIGLSEQNNNCVQMQAPIAQPKIEAQPVQPVQSTQQVQQAPLFQPEPEEIKTVEKPVATKKPVAEKKTQPKKIATLFDKLGGFFDVDDEQM